MSLTILQVKPSADTNQRNASNRRQNATRKSRRGCIQFAIDFNR